MQFQSVSVVPKYLNTATFQKICYISLSYDSILRYGEEKTEYI
jgi:hypothetical protein